MEKRIAVNLTGPVKIDGKYRRPGDSVEVTMETARELEVAGVIAPIGVGISVAELATGAPGFDEAVHSAAKLLAEEAVAEAVNAATATLVEGLVASRAESEALRLELAAAKASVPAADTNSEATPAEQEPEKAASKRQAQTKG